MDLLLHRIFICSLFAVLISDRRSTSRIRIPINGTLAPEPGGALPLLGHVNLLRGPVTRTLASMADKHGRAFVLRLGLNLALFASSRELAKERYTTHDLAMASWPRLVAGEHVGYNKTPISPSTRITQALRLAEINMSVKGLHKEWLKQGGEKLMIEIRSWFVDLTFNVLTMILAGNRGANWGGST